MTTSFTKRVLLSLAIIALLMPLTSKALTSAEVNAQIQLLLTQITTLQARIQQYSQTSVTPSTPYVPATPSVPSTSVYSAQSNVCPVLERALSLGMSGTDVMDLQRFLVAQGLLSQGGISGYYEAQTELAVRKWQASHGIVSSGSAETTGYGVVGPRTRTLIALNCSLNTTKSLTPLTSNDPEPLSCPIAPPPTTVCSTSWQAVTDSYGCTTSYTCSVPLPVAGSQSGTATSNLSSLTMIAPVEGLGIRQSTLMNIAWNSKDPQGKYLQLDLMSADSDTFVRSIASVAVGSPTGAYYWWTIPRIGENGYVPAGQYKVRGSIQSIETSSCSAVQGCQVYATSESGAFTIMQ